MRFAAMNRTAHSGRALLWQRHGLVPDRRRRDRSSRCLVLPSLAFAQTPPTGPPRRRFRFRTSTSASGKRQSPHDVVGALQIMLLLTVLSHRADAARDGDLVHAHHRRALVRAHGDRHAADRRPTRCSSGLALLLTFFVMAPGDQGRQRQRRPAVSEEDQISQPVALDRGARSRCASSCSGRRARKTSAAVLLDLQRAAAGRAKGRSDVSSSFRRSSSPS